MFTIKIVGINIVIIDTTMYGAFLYISFVIFVNAITKTVVVSNNINISKNDIGYFNFIDNPCVI